MPEGDVARTLADERARLTRHIADLAHDLDAIIEASAGSNADDEHDPEGSTIGFERAQVSSLLDQARARLADLEGAEARMSAGSYGECERCGVAISPERIAAQPTAAACVACTSPVTRRVRRP